MQSTPHGPTKSKIKSSCSTFCILETLCQSLYHFTLASFHLKALKYPRRMQLFTIFKGVLHPSTKISIFCLFSPSSRGKSILFMYGCYRWVWSKVKKHDIFFSMDLRISHVERFKIFLSLFNLRNHFKIKGINSCFYYSWNHPFSVKKKKKKKNIPI